MKFIALALVAGVVLAQHAVPVRAADARVVVQQAVEAAGGREALSRQKAVEWTAGGRVHIGELEIDYRGDWRMQFPDRFRFDLTATVMGQDVAITQSLAGEHGWKRIAAGAVEDLADHELKRLQLELRLSHAATLLPLLEDPKYQLSIAGEERVGDSDTIGINVTHENGLDANFYFDRQTHRLLKMQYQTVDEFGQDVSELALLSSFKTVDGVITPMKFDLRRGDKPFITANLSGLTIKDQLDAGLFERP